MKRPEPPNLASLSASQVQWVSTICNEFEDHWGRVDRPTIKEYMNRAGGDADDVARLVLLRELMTSELELRRQESEAHRVDAYRDLFCGPGEKDVVDFVLGDDTDAGGTRRFHVVKRHAQGGLGEVFIAHDRHVDRDVALKKIKPELAGDESSRNRFIREAEITGQLEHPNIAPVYSLGLDGDQLPFYAMRFIEGVPLHKAISDSEKSRASVSKEGTRLLALRKLLGRFNAVCDAVAFAHSRGILHRDIKPANVILGRFGETILADWGLAKKIGTADSDYHTGPREPCEQDAAQLTEYGSVLGTLPYMSPEQAQSATGPLTPASDIYSLGATLYHVLTGRPPFVEKDYELVRRKVIQGDFPAPRRVDPEIPRALEAIVKKAMARVPGDRYKTASALAEDIEHWLADEPVSAWHEPLSVQTGRRIRRHRTLVLSTATALFVGFIGSAAFSLVVAGKNRELDGQRRQALDQRNRAESEAEIARAINEFLNDDLLAQASADAQATPDTKADPDIKVRTVLDRAAARIKLKFADKPLVGASIHRTIGKTYSRLGLVPAATLHLERALELYRKALGDDNTTTLEAMSALGELYIGSNNPSLAENLLSQAREGSHRLHGPDHPDTLSATVTLAQVYQAEGKLDLAEGLYVGALKGLRRTRGNDHIATLEAVNNLGMLYQDQGKLADAEPLLVEARDGVSRLKGPANPDTLLVANNLAGLYYLRDKLVEAERQFDTVLKLRLEVLGSDHPSTWGTKSDLAFVYGRQRRLSEAEKTLRDVLEGKRKTLGPDNRSVLGTMESLATFCALQNKLDDAQQLLTKALDRCNSVYGANDLDTLRLTRSLGNLYQRLNKFDEAETLLRRAVDGFGMTLGSLHADTIKATYLLADCYRRQRKPEYAEPLSVEALDRSQRILGNEHPDTASARDLLGLVRISLEKYGDAETVLRECLKFRKQTAPDHWSLFNTESLLGGCLVAQKKYIEAETCLESAYRGMNDRENTMAPSDKRSLSEAAERLIQLYDACGNREKMEYWLTRFADLVFPNDAFAPP